VAGLRINGELSVWHKFLFVPYLQERYRWWEQQLVNSDSRFNWPIARET